jgi:hypothetical protein
MGTDACAILANIDSGQARSASPPGQRSGGSDTISTIPPEIVWIILWYLRYRHRERATARAVCRQWREILPETDISRLDYDLAMFTIIERLDTRVADIATAIACDRRIADAYIHGNHSSRVQIGIYAHIGDVVYVSVFSQADADKRPYCAAEFSYVSTDSSMQGVHVMRCGSLFSGPFVATHNNGNMTVGTYAVPSILEVTVTAGDAFVVVPAACPDFYSRIATFTRIESVATFAACVRDVVLRFRDMPRSDAPCVSLHDRARAIRTENIPQYLVPAVKQLARGVYYWQFITYADTIAAAAASLAGRACLRRA